MRTRTPLGLWLAMNRAERAAYEAMNPDHYIDLTDLGEGSKLVGCRPGDDAADTAEETERLGMTEGEHRAWQWPRQSSGSNKL